MARAMMPPGKTEFSKKGESRCHLFIFKKVILLPPLFVEGTGGCQAVLWIRNYFFWIRIPFSSESWIRILLYLQKVPDPVPDPALNIHSFSVLTILKVFSWHFKASFSLKMLDNCHYYQIANFFDDFW
jgi:hypothetical protein